MAQRMIHRAAGRKGGVRLSMNEFIFLAIALLATAILIYVAVRYGNSLRDITDGFF